MVVSSVTVALIVNLVMLELSYRLKTLHGNSCSSSLESVATHKIVTKISVRPLSSKNVSLSLNSILRAVILDFILSTYSEVKQAFFKKHAIIPIPLNFFTIRLTSQFYPKIVCL